MKHLYTIIDASIFAKWYIPGEKDRELALRIRDNYEGGVISIVLPAIARYEVSNFLKTSVKRLRIAEELAKKTYKRFLNSDFIIYSSNELLEMTLEKAIAFDISSYDAAYVTLAEYLQIPFYTADEKLVRKTGNKYVYSILDYLRQV